MERETDNCWRNETRFRNNSERSILCTLNSERPRIFQIRTSLRGWCMKPQNLQIKNYFVYESPSCESNDLRSSLLRDLPNKFHCNTDIDTIHLLQICPLFYEILYIYFRFAHYFTRNMPSAEEATALKQKGNTAFANHDWIKAVDYYTQAIHINDQEPSFYCNRAQASS